MSIMKQIKVEYNDLKPGQKKIADYFLTIDFEGLNGTIEEIAEDIGTSVASISRFCKRLGFDGFRKFKITFSRDLGYEPEQVLPIFDKDDTPELSIKKVFSEAVTNLQATEGVVNVEALQKVAESIRRCHMLYFLGLGGSGEIGSLGEIQFSHLGNTTRALTEPYIMLVCAGHARPEDVFVCISHTGKTKVIIEAASIAKENGAFIVAITNYAESPLALAADIVLQTASHERKIHFAQSNSMVAQLTIIRALYILVASQGSNRTITKINAIEESVDRGLRLK